MGKSVQDCVIRALSDLSEESFKLFKVKLCETREIGYGRIEKGSPVDVAVKIISLFTKAGAVGQTAKVLRGIQLNEEAEALEKEAGAVAGAVRKQENRGDMGQKDGALGSMADDKHFMDRHMRDLINSVTLVCPDCGHELMENHLHVFIDEEILKPTQRVRRKSHFRSVLSFRSCRRSVLLISVIVLSGLLFTGLQQLSAQFNHFIFDHNLPVDHEEKKDKKII